MTNGLVLYSSSTDVTGAALADSLGFKGAKEWDGAYYDVVISWGWGNKKGEESVLADISKKTKLTINNPQNVRSNSNKAIALKKMADKGVLVPDFFTAETIKEALASGKTAFPVIGRMRNHQGGKHFFLCLENKAVDWALENECNLFTKYLPKDTEYRIHVLNGKVIQACIKEHQKNHEAGWKKLKTDLILMKAEKANVEISEDQLEFILDYFIGRDFELPNYVVRSNKLGWKFSFINDTPEGVKQAALDACKAVGLEFGAVDIVVTDDKQVVVLEVNSGPGLCASMLGKYVAGFNSMISHTSIPSPEPIIKAVSYNGDKPSAAKVANLLANLEPEHFKAVISMLNNATDEQIAGLSKLLSFAA